MYNQLDDNEAAIWSLLLASGYLKVLDFRLIDKDSRETSFMYEVALTNREVKYVFYNMVRGWFARVGGDYNDFLKALLRDDLEEMNAYMERVTRQTFSYFYTGNCSPDEMPERFYHGFVLGLIADLDKDYIITSNRESGFGRYDVMLEPRKPEKDAIIMEFKVHNAKKESSLDDTVQVALTQIEKKAYDAALNAKGIPKEEDLLEKREKDIHFCLITDGSSEMQREMMRVLGIIPLFDEIMICIGRSNCALCNH